MTLEGFFTHRRRAEPVYASFWKLLRDKYAEEEYDPDVIFTHMMAKGLSPLALFKLYPNWIGQHNHRKLCTGELSHMNAPRLTHIQKELPDSSSKGLPTVYRSSLL